MGSIAKGSEEHTAKTGQSAGSGVTWAQGVRTKFHFHCPKSAGPVFGGLLNRHFGRSLNALGLSVSWRNNTVVRAYRVFRTGSFCPSLHTLEFPPSWLRYKPAPCPLMPCCRYLRGKTYVDCYFTEIASRVSHAEYVEAFYTTAVFKLERWILRWFVAKSSADAQARELAHGTRDSFAAWSVEGREVDQLLLCDFQGRTRSWLMTSPIAGGTCLYFGSAVVPVVDARTGDETLGFVFSVLLGFHKLYSRILLRAAVRRLEHRLS
jgi:hypothetical protein